MQMEDLMIMKKIMYKIHENINVFVGCEMLVEVKQVTKADQSI